MSKMDCVKECTDVKQCKFYIYQSSTCYLGDFEAIDPLPLDQLTDLMNDVKVEIKDSN